MRVVRVYNCNICEFNFVAASNKKRTSQLSQFIEFATKRKHNANTNALSAALRTRICQLNCRSSDKEANNFEIYLVCKIEFSFTSQFYFRRIAFVGECCSFALQIRATAKQSGASLAPFGLRGVQHSPNCLQRAPSSRPARLRLATSNAKLR